MKKKITYKDIRLHRDAAEETKRRVNESVAEFGAAMICSPDVEPITDDIDVDVNNVDNADNTNINNQANI